MKNYWVSWYHSAHFFGTYRLSNPTWCTGASDSSETVCAAIKAKDEQCAAEQIYKCYDNRPEHIDFRFIEERPEGWTPFNDRFPRAEWMKWK